MSPTEWVRRSIAAGHNPMAVYQPDGKRGIYTDWGDIDDTISPPPVEKEDLSAVLHELVAMGRFVDFRKGISA